MSNSILARLAAAGRALVRGDSSSSSSSYLPSLWQNAATGMGGGYDKTSFHVPTRITPLQVDHLAWLYLGDAFAGRIVSARVDDALRQGWRISYGGGTPSDEDLIPEIEQRLSALGAVDAVRHAAKWGLCFGFGGIVLVTNGGTSPADQPLDDESVASLDRLLVVDRRDVSIIGRDPAGRHEVYRLQLVTQAIQASGPIHASRVIRFGGRDTALRDSVAYFDGFDASVLQPVWEVVRGFNQSWAGATAMLVDGSVGVLKLPGLAELLGMGGRATLAERLLAMKTSLWMGRWLPIDATETLEYVSRQFGGIPDLLQEQKTLVAAAAEMPVTRLFGVSPAGLNATGLSDEKAWYSTVAAYQASTLTPPVSRLLSLVARELGAAEPEAFTPTWPPIEVMNATETAALDESICRADTLRVQLGMTEETILRHRYGGATYRTDPPLLDDAELAALEVVTETAPLEPAEPAEPAELVLP